MTNPFHFSSLVPSWANVVLKGDLPGHAFHGNQWTAAADAQMDLHPANNLHLLHSDDQTAADTALQHEAAAKLHSEQRDRLKALAQVAVDAGHPTTANRLKEAAGAHAEASLDHANAAKVTWDKGIGQESVDAAYPAIRASRDANEATHTALEQARAVGLAPADLMKSVDFTKGDVAGHPFHGNQYTEGSLSDTSTRLANYVHGNRTNLSPMDAKYIADSHEQHADLHSDAAQQLRQHVDMITSPENLHRDGEATKAQVQETLKTADRLTKAADAHEKAAEAHTKAADVVLKAQGEWGGRLGLDEKAPTASQVSAATNAAAKASIAAEKHASFDDANAQLPLGA